MPILRDQKERPVGEAMPLEQKRAYGCVFCITGKEQAVADRIAYLCPEIRALAVYQEKHKSICGKKTRIKTILLPGYVFFDAPDDPGIVAALPQMDIIRLLKNQEQDWRLSGADVHFAQLVFKYQGCLDFSTAYNDGDRIRILSGPLKDMEALITSVDRRGRSGQVTVHFNGREIKVWLGFELVEPLKNQQEK